MLGNFLKIKEKREIFISRVISEAIKKSVFFMVLYAIRLVDY